MPNPHRRGFLKAGLGALAALTVAEETAEAQTKKGPAKPPLFERPEMTEAELRRGPIFNDPTGAIIVDGRGYSRHRFQTPINGPNVIVIDAALERHPDGALGFTAAPGLANVKVPPPASAIPGTAPLTYKEILTNTAIERIAKKQKVDFALVLTDNNPSDGKAPMHAAAIGKLTGASVVGMFKPGFKGQIMSDADFNNIDRRSQVGDPLCPGKEYDEKVKAGKDHLGYITLFYKKPGTEAYVEGPRWTMQQLAGNDAIFDAKKAGRGAEEGQSDDMKLRMVHAIDAATNLQPAVKNAMLVARPDGVALAQQPGAPAKEKREVGKPFPAANLIPELKSAPPPKGADEGLPQIKIPRAGLDMKEMRRGTTELGGGGGIQV